MTNQASVECPNCGTPIDVDDVLRAKVEKNFRQEYEQKIQKERQSLKGKEEQLREIQRKFVEEKESYQEKLENAVNDQIKKEKEALRTELKAQLSEEHADQLKTLQLELNSKSEKLKELNQAKAEVEKLKREKQEIRSEIELESQKKLNEQIEIERLKLAKSEREKAELKMAERDKIIEDLNNKLKDAQRKAEQGSMQLQGEVQELAIEEWLRNHFPLDTIEEIKKGARGGDCVQIVNTRSTMNCGTIYYESKRTQAWSPTWIEKFKIDMRERGADIGVIVTEAMPKNMDRVGMIDGLWVCTYQEFKGLCKVLRQQILAISQAVASQENKGDKMEMLYNFLTSNEFKLQIEGIVGAFTTMQDDLHREQRAMQKIWKQRQKQIEKVTDNTIAMYGSIRGIAGNAIQSVPALELPGTEDEEMDSLI